MFIPEEVVGGAEKMPASGRFAWIHRGVPGSYGHRTCRHSRSWCGSTWKFQCRRKPCEIGESG
jgi:hypothetical protein